MKRALKIGCLAVVAVLILGIVSIRVAVARAHDRYFDDYQPSLPFHAESTAFEVKDGYEVEKVYFESRQDEKVPTLITFPVDHKGKLPLILFLHGIGQKKDFIEEICLPFNVNGFAMACFDQATRGERKGPKGQPFLKGAADFYARPWKTVNDSRRFLDYAATREDIDPKRIYLVGASYGAITGSTVAAFDERVRATVLVYGGANLSQLLDSDMNRTEVGKLYPSLVPALPYLYSSLSYWLDPADPIHYANRIAPRPVLIQNGKTDSLIPTLAAEALQNAVGDPKKVIWYEGDHIGFDAEVVAQVLKDGLIWILEQDKEFRGGSAAPAPETDDVFKMLASRVEEASK